MNKKGIIVKVFLAAVLFGGVSLIVARLVLAATSSITDTFSDSSLIDSANSSGYIVAGGQLKTTFNNGADGDQTLTGNINNAIFSNGRAYPDGVAFQVSALGTNTITAISNPNGISVNDEVILINTYSSDLTNWTNVGNYEFFRVTNKVNAVLTLDHDITKIYGATSSNANLSGQYIIVQRVPNYGNVTISGTLTGIGWSGTSPGGLIVFRSSGTLTNSGAISMSEKGYKGATAQTSISQDGHGGQAYCGPGGATEGASGAGGNGANAAAGNGICGGGGGGGTAGVGQARGGAGGGGKRDFGGSGGGAGYGTIGYGGNGGGNGATNDSGNGGTSNTPGGGGGGTYGSANLSKLYMGGGGGGGGSTWQGGAGGCGSCGYSCVAKAGGAGGRGGGMIYIVGNTVTAGSIVNNGANGTIGVTGCQSSGSGGGGAGGSIFIGGNTVAMGAGVSAVGGQDGGSTLRVTAGGNGGSGRIAVYTSDGTDTGTATPAENVYTASWPTTTVQSVNLLSTQTELIKSIDSFVYNLSSKPTASTATIQFSQNATNWYSSAGVLNGSDTLTTGSNNSINLSGLSWSGANFYYKVTMGGPASPILDDVKVNFTYHLMAPTIGTPTALSTTSIRWAFTDNADDEVGFKVYDTGNVLKVTCATANATYCDETGLSPGTSYTRKVAAYDANGIGKYSDTATKTTLSLVPQKPSVTSGTSNSINVDVVPGAGAAGTDTYAIYVMPKTISDPDTTVCDGNQTGGRYVQANGQLGGAGSGNGVGTEIWQTDATWGTVTVTGATGTPLDLESNVYAVCVKGKNVGGTQTAFGDFTDNNGGYLPYSGAHYTGGTISNKYNDGAADLTQDATTHYIWGVDNGTSNGTNTAIFKLGGSITLNKYDTLIVGKLSLESGGEINFDQTNPGTIIVGGRMYLMDQDGDSIPRRDVEPAKNHNNPSTLEMFYLSKTGSPTAGWKRRSAFTSLTSLADCNDNDGGTNGTPGAGAGHVWVAHTPTCYGDLDGDTVVGDLKNANTTCLSGATPTATTATCDTATKASLAGDGNAVATFGIGKLLTNAGTDCNDQNANVYVPHVGGCWTDADSDGYTTTQNTAVACTNNADCAASTKAMAIGDSAAAASTISVNTYRTSQQLNPLGASDCNDAVAAIYQNITTCHADGDGDGYGVAANTTVCTGASCVNATTPGYVDDNTDCYDGNALAYPGSATCLSTVRGDASYDYNCSGTNTRCGTTYHTATNATCQSTKYCTGWAGKCVTTTLVACGSATGYVGGGGSCSGTTRCTGGCSDKATSGPLAQKCQ